MPGTGQKTTVVLFNMGGPKDQASVRSFLRNLFADPAIMNLPFGLRHLLAEWISRRREKPAQANYQLLGGGSPLMGETENQRAALEKMLNQQNQNDKFLCVTAMRYSQPSTSQAIEKARDFMPDQVVLLPLYPQYSHTTSGSSLGEWVRRARKDNWKTFSIESYPTSKTFIKAHVEQILQTWKQANSPQNIRVLFSAHGLPEKNIAAGDPYQSQIEASVAKIIPKLPDDLQDCQICYQSRVGPLKWIGPNMIDEIARAGRDNKNLLVVPIAFVSEHIETRVELDIECAELAIQAGIEIYLRVPTLRTNERFIEALAEQVQIALQGSV
ncbi:MAG: ferrochelatase [Robiginitomaculum sp.]|nr:MAG: ferrochelatase [Robiginitomaculum sp.]